MKNSNLTLWNFTAFRWVKYIVYCKVTLKVIAYSQIHENCALCRKYPEGLSDKIKWQTHVHNNGFIKHVLITIMHGLTFARWWILKSNEFWLAVSYWYCKYHITFSTILHSCSNFLEIDKVNNMKKYTVFMKAIYVSKWNNT